MPVNVRSGILGMRVVEGALVNNGDSSTANCSFRLAFNSDPEALARLVGAGGTFCVTDGFVVLPRLLIPLIGVEKIGATMGPEIKTNTKRMKIGPQLKRGFFR